MSNKIFVVLANGFELIEALAPVDVLRRAGLEVVMVSTENSLEVISAQKVKVVAEAKLSEINSADGAMVVIPGGYPGYVHLRENQQVVALVKEYLNAGKFIGAICGGPTVLGINGLIADYNYTCHSAVKDEMASTNYQNVSLVVHKNLITSCGAGQAIDFGLALAKMLVSEEKILEVKKGMELA